MQKKKLLLVSDFTTKILLCTSFISYYIEVLLPKVGQISFVKSFAVAVAEEAEENQAIAIRKEEHRGPDKTVL